MSRPVPACLRPQPLDNAARDGSHQLVLGDGQFACAAWREGRWLHSSGTPLGFQPTEYHRFGETP